MNERINELSEFVILFSFWSKTVKNTPWSK